MSRENCPGQARSERSITGHICHITRFVTYFVIPLVKQHAIFPRADIWPNAEQR